MYCSSSPTAFIDEKQSRDAGCGTQITGAQSLGTDHKRFPLIDIKANTDICGHQYNRSE